VGVVAVSRQAFYCVPIIFQVSYAVTGSPEVDLLASLTRVSKSPDTDNKDSCSEYCHTIILDTPKIPLTLHTIGYLSREVTNHTNVAIMELQQALYSKHD
jgi:hypothetical protein